MPVFEVEVIPGEESDPSTLTFDWNVVSMTDREIAIQIYFDKAVYVSANTEPDTLKLSFVDKYMFVSTNNLPIDLESSVSVSRRRQLELVHSNRNSNHDDYYDYD